MENNTKIGRMENKDDPVLVAEQGFKALMDNKDQVLAGSLKSRMKNSMNDLMPETVRAGMLGEMAKPDQIH